VPHTFGTLLIPLAFILVLWGIYMVAHTISQPLNSDSASVLFGSFLLASGLLLFSYLLRSIRISTNSNVRKASLSVEQPVASPTSLLRG
jgi:uncharacterized membrane protein